MVFRGSSPPTGSSGCGFTEFFLNAMVLVKPATVVQWHRKGFRLSWRWRSRRLGRPQMSTESFKSKINAFTGSRS